MGSRTYAPFMIAGMVVSWAVFYAVSKYTVGLTGSPFAAGLLLRGAALVFLTVQLAKAGKISQALRPRKLLLLIAIGGFGFLLDTFANLGYAHGSLSTGTALLKTDVLMVNLATVVIYRKKLYATDWAGTFIMLFGVLMVLNIDWGGLGFNVFDLFFLLSALCVTANAFLIKNGQERWRLDADVIAYYNNLVVLVLFAGSSLVTGDLDRIPWKAGPEFWGLALLGGLAQACIYYFYYRNLTRYEVWVVKLYLLLMPILSCVIGVLFLGETFSLKKAAGVLVVLAGAAVILMRAKLHPQANNGGRG